MLTTKNVNKDSIVILRICDVLVLCWSWTDTNNHDGHDSIFFVLDTLDNHFRIIIVNAKMS